LHAALSAQRINPTGPGGGIFSNAIFSHAHGEATVFVPCDGKVRGIGRVASRVVPAVALATYVTRHALAVEGPLREYYLVGPQDTSDASAWRTEVGWPIFQTG
jgi:hypothetical protein